jgi:hypothetical protein
MDGEVLRVVMEIIAFFALAAAGISGFRSAGFGMAALGVALLVPAMDALDYADHLHLFRCDEACGNSGAGSSHGMLGSGARFGSLPPLGR